MTRGLDEDSFNFRGVTVSGKMPFSLKLGGSGMHTGTMAANILTDAFQADSNLVLTKERIHEVKSFNRRQTSKISNSSSPPSSSSYQGKCPCMHQSKPTDLVEKWRDSIVPSVQDQQHRGHVCLTEFKQRRLLVDHLLQV